MKIIDTHQHLWDLNQFSYSWTANQPSLNRSFQMADYLAATAGFEIVKSVHVEADVDEAFMLDETKHVLALADQDGNPLSGVVASGRPESDNFRAYLEQLGGHPGLKGIRRLLQSEPDELSTTTTFVENIRALAEFDLSFDLCVRGRQLPQAIQLVERCPDVQFVLDHCGNPEIKTGDITAWRNHLAEIAALPNVVCKVSGIVVNTDLENWNMEDLRPAIEHVIACFGWDRVVFGSDWPVCTLAASFKRWVETLSEIVADASEENRHKLFYENATRIYRL